MKFNLSSVANLLTAVLLLGPVVATAQPDLVGTVSLVGASQRPAPGRNRVAFEVLVHNQGTSVAKGALSLKPFVLPLINAPYFSNEANGTTLEAQTLDVEIQPNGVQAVRFEADVQVEVSAPLGLAVVINSKNTIEESDSRNNVTDLFPLGTMSLSMLPKSTSGFDLYTETPKGFEFFDGGLQHYLRTNIRRYGATWPPRREDSGALWGRFMLADLNSKKVYTMPYQRDISKVDKQWYSVYWNEELEPNGDSIGVDYYTQAPSFEHVPPGDYRFVVMINHREHLAETNVHNNLESKPVRIEPYRLLFNPGRNGTPVSVTELWFSEFESGTVAPVQPVVMSLSYRGQLTYEVTQVPSWLELTDPTGELRTGASRKVVNFKTSQSAPKRAEINRSEILFKDSRFNLTRAVPVKRFVWSTDRTPYLGLSATDLNFTSTQTVTPRPQQIVITNPGTAPLEYRVDHNLNWVTVRGAQGTVAPGGSAVVEVAVHPYVLSPFGREEGYLYLQSSAVDGNKAIPVVINHTVR